LIAPRMLYWATIGFGLVGVALRVLPPPHLSASPLTPLLSTSERPVGATREDHRITDPNAYEAIVAGDVFSPTRTPPDVRFTPDRATGEPAAVPGPRRRTVQEPSVRLVGITMAPSGAVALIETNRAAGGAGAAIYRVGDRVGEGSVATITDSMVLIARERGSLVLRLPPAKKTRP
jgi:hypothetical protein